MRLRVSVCGFALAALILAAGLPIPAPAQSKSIQIKGSDTMVNLGQAWAEAFNKKKPGLNIAVTGGGSGTGMTALVNGTCDIAESSRAIEAKEIQAAKAKGFTPVEWTVAMDGIAVVVNPKNPVQKLTLGQLRDIFLGTIDNWKTLGGPNKEIVILSREFNSGTHIFFKEHVLRKGIVKGPEEFSPTALLMPSSQAIADEVANNINAVGYFGMGYISPRQKVVAVAADAKSPYFEPTLANVKSKIYPISRPLFFYTKGQPQGLIKEFIDFAFSAEGQELVKKADFVPIK
jgi:phosphate transport system substrate-binding protein